MVKCMVLMHRWCCRDHANYYMSKLQFDQCALLSQKDFGWKYAPCWVYLVQTFTQTFRIWLRFCADIWTKNRRLASLISMVFYIKMVVKQLGSRVAQLVGGAKVGHGAMVAKSDPRRLLSSQELLVRCHPFLSCSPSPATRVPNTDHHDFPPKSIDDLCKDTASRTPSIVKGNKSLRIKLFGLV